MKGWQILPQSEWPRWVVRAATDSVLRSALRKKRPFVFRGKTFLYRVTPEVVTTSMNGHDGSFVKIASIGRRLRHP